MIQSIDFLNIYPSKLARPAPLDLIQEKQVAEGVVTNSSVTVAYSWYAMLLDQKPLRRDYLDQYVLQSRLNASAYKKYLLLVELNLQLHLFLHKQLQKYTHTQIVVV